MPDRRIVTHGEQKEKSSHAKPENIILIPFFYKEICK